jgi:putative restriction endonuclease
MTSSPDATSKAYSAVENRQQVAEHLRRERSALLAAKAKLRDGYTCQICDLNFEEAYGRIGRGFAEAHHRMALSKLRPKVETKLADLATVCSNCHRMLHKMNGTRSDVSALRRAVNARHRSA